MVIQYGFITIFVCVFPLAPLFALLNNAIELRLDARTVLVQYRRPPARKVQSIGVWFDILETLGTISVVTNSFIIALTSEFIPRTLYRLMVPTLTQTTSTLVLIHMLGLKFPSSADTQITSTLTIARIGTRIANISGTSGSQKFYCQAQFQLAVKCQLN